MERDFLGLGSKEPVIPVKEEINNDVCKEIGFTKGSGIQWPFSDKVTAVPQFMSFKVIQEDKTKKVVSDPLGSSRFMPFSAADAYEHNQRGSKADVQDVHSLQHSHDIKTFPASNQAISVSINNPFFKNHFATIGQNMGGPNVKQQLLGVPVTAPHSILPTIGSVVGVAEPGNNVKARGSPQLTIFYAGTVSVYEDISPEKAQAIMLLAGNGSSLSAAPNSAQPKFQVQAPSLKLTTAAGVTVNHPINTAPCTGLSSPTSISSDTGAQSGSGSTSTEEPMAAKTTGVATTPICKLEPPNTAKAMGSFAATGVTSAGHSNLYAGFPQARKASLALFLEKRKQRVTNAAPYLVNKKSSEDSVLKCNGFNLSAISAAASDATTPN